MPLIPFHLRVATLLAFVTLSNVPVYAAPTVASQDFGSSPVATPVNISVAIPAVTPGPVSLSLRYSIDFSLGGCTPNASGRSAAVTFDPTKPGLRQDALIVKDGNGRVVEEVFLHGIGVGAVPVFSPAAATLQFCGGAPCGDPNFGYLGIAAEANGRILVPNSAGNAIYEFDPKTSNATIIPGVPATTSSSPVVQGIAVDAAGNIFYGYYDYDNPSALGIHRIDVITGTDAVVVSAVHIIDLVVAPIGTIYYVAGDQVFAADANSYAVTLIAGNGTHGFGGDGGRALNAELANPYGIVLDNSGNLYVADSGNQRIRRIDRTGTITTIAGTGEAANSGDGGLAINAALVPRFLAIDSAGDLYVSTGGIRRIDAGSGLISTVAGANVPAYNFVGANPSISAQQMAGGFLTIDPDGNLWTISIALYEISISAYPIQFAFATAGQSSAQTISLLNAGNANLNQPAMSVSGVNSTGFTTASTCAPEIAPGTACPITINFTAGSDVTPQATVTLTENGWPSSQTIPVSGASGGLPPATKQVSTVQVGASSAAPEVANVQFAGNASGLTASLAYGIEFSLGQPSCSGTGSVSCSVPVTFSPRYPGLRQDAIQFLDATGNVVYQCFLSATGRGPQWFSDPEQVGSLTLPSGTLLSAIDAAGNLYASSSGGAAGDGQVYKFTKNTNQWTMVAGQATGGFNSGDGGPATSATLAYVTSAVVDAAGNLYIGETSAVRRVDARTGIVTTIANQGGSLFTIDSHGYLYFLDSARYKVDRLDPSTGVITTYAGTGKYGVSSSGDGGPATAANIGYVYALAVDAAGNLFISTDDPSIRRVDVNSGIITTYSQSCGYGNITFDPAGDLLQPCGGLAIFPPSGGKPQFSNTTTLFNVDLPMLRDPSGTFYTSEGMVLGPGLQPTSYLGISIVGASSQGAIQLLNSGNESLPISSVDFSGANAAQFSENNTCGQSLSPAQSCAVTFTFTPVQAGAATSTLTVSSTLPPLQTTINSAGVFATLQLSPGILNFGTIRSSAPIEAFLKVLNSGSVPATIYGFSISGPNASDFTADTSNCPAVLVANQYCLVFVTFQAGASGTRTASLSISDIAAGSPQTIPLSAVVSPRDRMSVTWRTGVSVTQA